MALVAWTIGNTLGHDLDAVVDGCILVVLEYMNVLDMSTKLSLMANL